MFRCTYTLHTHCVNELVGLSVPPGGALIAFTFAYTSKKHVMGLKTLILVIICLS